MAKAEHYREELAGMADWDAYLLAESGLPGPRGNLELAHVVADLGDQALFERYLAHTADVAPTNDPREFLAFCGALGLGRLLAEGQTELLARLRAWANDPRWRMREAVAQALQKLGDKDMSALVAAVEPWINGTLLERRAVAAGLCEPRLLGEAAHAKRTLEILAAITASLEGESDRRSEEFKALRKALAYCWSVAVVALPQSGKPLFEALLTNPDKDVQWIAKQNLGKNRLVRMDAEWVASLKH
jgi:HEAT repeat protein